MTPPFRELIQTYFTDKDKHALLKEAFVDSLEVTRLKKIEELKKKTDNIVISHYSLKDDLRLSPSPHNIFEKFLVEDVASHLSKDAKVVYVTGDTKKDLYFNKELVDYVGLEIDIHQKILDVIVCDDWCTLSF